MMTTDLSLGRMAADEAMRGAAEYLAAHGLQVDTAVLVDHIRDRAKRGLRVALAEARGAADAGMQRVGAATFLATMRLVGVEAAKEAALRAGGPNTEKGGWTMRIEIRNHETGETIEIRRDVCHDHPAWVHEQLGTSGEVELQQMLDQMHLDDYYDHDGRHLGPDVDGVAMYRGD